MPAPTAPRLDLAGTKAGDVTLADAVFTGEPKPHLIHETVRAEAWARRAGTQAAKTRGLVSGGRSKPWRQKGTGRARAGSTRAPQWTGGGVAFPPKGRGHDVKVNRKARKAALRAALTRHAVRGSLAVVDASLFSQPSSKSAADFLAGWGGERPLVVIAGADESNLAKSFRNLERVTVLEPWELEVGALVWARSLLVTESALERIQDIAGGEAA